MAEVVGAVAAVVQFVDVALRLSSCLERFCSDVRNVPRRFVQLQTDLRQQIEIAQQIQNHHLPGFATTISSSKFDTPLIDYIDLAEELRKTLEALLARKSDGVFQRGWDAICSIRKKEEVASICDRLEQKKSTLSLWLEAANLKLTSSIVATTDETRLDVNDTLTLIKTVNNTSNDIATNTAQLLPHIEQVDRTLATTSIRTERILENSQRLLTGYDASVSVQESSRQSTARILANTEQIIAAIEKLSISPGNYSPHVGGGYVVDHMYVGSPSTPHAQQSTVNRGRIAQRCKCRTVSTARRWQPLSILRFTRTFRSRHFSYCPHYRDSEQSLEITMQIVPPSWLLYHTIDFSTHVRNWSTRKNFSMSSIIVGTSRLVDSKTSPAFRAISDAECELRELRNTEQDRRKHQILTQLHNALQRLLENSEASVLDVDSDGRTLLNETVHLFISDIDRSRIAEYAALFQFLVDRGADPNVIRDLVPMHRFSGLTNHGGTPCDQLMDPMSFHLTHDPVRVQGLRTILDLFVKAEGHTSKPFVSKSSPGNRCIRFRSDVTQLTLFEDQIDIMGLGDLVPIIIQQQEEHFRRIIKKAKPSILDRKSPVNGLAPIHFAVLWPTGLRMLVERGVDVNIEDNYGRRPVHLAVALGIDESVRCLLNADCGLFTPVEDYSLFQYALSLRDEEERSDILLQVTRALRNRHTRLIDLANLCLPPSVFDKLELAPHGLQEQRAPSIAEKLLSHGIEVPPALELDGKGLYLSTTAGYNNVHIKPDAADTLFSAGFDDIDKSDEHGWTPFLQSWFYHNFEMVDWFGSRGLALDCKHAETHLTGLHLYTKGMDLEWTLSNVTSSMEKHYIESIQKKLGIPYDGCTCTCSPKGCTPVKFIFENDDGYCYAPQKYQIRKFIKDLNPPKRLMNQYIYHLTRHILFDLLGGEHTCCSLGQEYGSSWRLQKPTRNVKWRKTYRDPTNVLGEHDQCCMNGLPVPRWASLRALRDPDVFSATLDSAMSHYDEMERPDTMPAEGQVYAYINWILEEGYLDIDVSNGCEHDLDEDSE